MYGSELTDPLVRYYDETMAATASADAEWYLEKAKRYGGPVLDLACGTGRIALLLLQNGFTVTALDQSVGMLNLLRKKLEQESHDVRNSVEIATQSMSDFHLGREFSTVICCDAFFHNLTVEHEIACLRAVARHLAPKGRFLFDLPNPTYGFILKTASSEDAEFEMQGKYRLRSAPGHIIVERLEKGSFPNQTIETTLRFTKYDENDGVVERTESFWKTRYLFKYEAIHLLYRCGFEIESLVGGYQDQPVGENGQLVFQVKLQG